MWTAQCLATTPRHRFLKRFHVSSCPIVTPPPQLTRNSEFIARTRSTAEIAPADLKGLWAVVSRKRAWEVP